MTIWYKDIFPCEACKHARLLVNKCKKGHATKRLDGCDDCGLLVNMKWFFWDEKCKDFDFIAESDPSGS